MPFTNNAGIFFQMPDYASDGKTYQFHSCYQGHYDEFPDLFNKKNASVRKQTREVISMLERDTNELFPQFKDKYNWKMAHCGIYCIAQSPGLVGDKRPSMKTPGVSNLYLVSSTVREARGIGVAAVAKCAQMAVKEIISK
jgi:phytoene dehydrogenase-like protein